MESNGSDRGKLLTAGGILSIVAGIFQIIEGWVMTNFFYDRAWFFWWPLQSPLDVWSEHIRSLAQIPDITPLPIWQMIIGGLIVVLGIIAIAGGVSAIRRKSFGLSLAGAICVLPSVHLGILAVIFVAFGKREFGVEGKGNGI